MFVSPVLILLIMLVLVCGGDYLTVSGKVLFHSPRKKSGFVNNGWEFRFLRYLYLLLYLSISAVVEEDVVVVEVMVDIEVVKVEEEVEVEVVELWCRDGVEYSLPDLTKIESRLSGIALAYDFQRGKNVLVLSPSITVTA